MGVSSWNTYHPPTTRRYAPFTSNQRKHEAKHSCNQATYPPGAEKTCAHKPWQLRSKNFCTSQKQRGERWTGAQLLSNDPTREIWQLAKWISDPRTDPTVGTPTSVKACCGSIKCFRILIPNFDAGTPNFATRRLTFSGRLLWKLTLTVVAYGVFFWVEPTINEVLGRYNIERMIFHKPHAGSTSISTVNIVYMGWLGQQKMNGFPMIFQSTHHPIIRAILWACLKRGEASPATKKSLFYRAVILR